MVRPSWRKLIPMCRHKAQHGSIPIAVRRRRIQRLRETVAGYVTIEFVADPSPAAWWQRGEILSFPPDLADWFIVRGVAVVYRRR
jgi:hypothetical protein